MEGKCVKQFNVLVRNKIGVLLTPAALWIKRMNGLLLDQGKCYSLIICDEIFNCPGSQRAMIAGIESGKITALLIVFTVLQLAADGG